MPYHFLHNKNQIKERIRWTKAKYTKNTITLFLQKINTKFTHDYSLTYSFKTGKSYYNLRYLHSSLILYTPIGSKIGLT